MALVTTASFKTWRGITDTSLDARIAVYIAEAEDFADTYTGRTLERQTDVEETYDGNGSPLLFLRNSPIVSISSIKQVHGDNSETTIASTDYRFATNDDARTSVCRISGSGYGWCSTRNSTPVWDAGCLNWKVTYTAGYESGSAPAALEMAIYRMVDHLINLTEREVGASDVQSEALGSYNYTLAAYVEQTQSLRDLLGPYRRLC